MHCLIPIFAAWGDLLEFLIPLVFFILYGVGQLLAGKEQVRRKAKPPRPQPAAGKAGGRPRGNVEDRLRGEVEDFLRRVQGEQPKEEVPRQPQDVEEPRTPVRRLSKETPHTPTLRQPAPAEIRESKPSLRKESFKEQASRFRAAETIAQQVAKLGDEVEVVDDRMEAHIKEAFEHKLGTFQYDEEAKAETPGQPVNIAATLAEMLTHPEGMRQLIVANEILRRPEF